MAVDVAYRLLDNSEVPPTTPGKRPRKPRSRWRRVLRVVLLVLAVPLTLVLLVVGYLHTGWGQDLVRRKVEERVAGMVNGSFALGRLDFALFGSLALGDVRIADEAGEQVVALRSLRVEPSWSDLLGGRIVIDVVEIDGVSLHLVQDEDGGSNLKRLFKPRPPKPEEPDAPPPKERRFVVGELRIADVDVVIVKPDGTRLSVVDAALRAHIDATPLTRTFDVKVPEVRGAFHLDKPDGSLRLALTGIHTGLTVSMASGSGSLTVQPTAVHARLEQPGAEPRQVQLDLDGVSLGIEDGQLQAELSELLVGALALESLELRGATKDGGLSGDQRVQIVGLHLDRAKLNTLLQRELVATDVAIETKIAGPPERLELDSAVKTAGGNLSLQGTVDASQPSRPSYDVALRGDDIGSERLVHAAALALKLPTIELEKIRLGLRGSGRTRAGAEVDIGLNLGPLTINQYTLDRLQLAGQFDGGVVRFDPLVVEAYGQRVELVGSYDLDTKHLDATLSVAGDVGPTLDGLRAAGLAITARVPHRQLDVRPGQLTLAVKGNLEGLLAAHLRIDRLAVAGGTVGADVRATAVRHATPPEGGKAVELKALTGRVDVDALSLKTMAGLAGKKLDGLTGLLSLQLDVDRVPEEPRVRYDLELRTQPSDAPRLQAGLPTLRLSARGEADKGWLRSHIRAVRQDTRTELLRADVRAPLRLDEEPKGIDPYRLLAAEIDIPRRRFAELVALVPARLLLDKTTGKPRNIPEGDVRAHVEVGGSLHRPQALFDVDLHARAIGAKEPTGPQQRVRLVGRLRSPTRLPWHDEHAVEAAHPAPRPTLCHELPAGPDQTATLRADAWIWLDDKKPHVATATALARLSPPSLKAKQRAVRWLADVTVSEQTLASLPLPAETLEKVACKIGLGVCLHGDRRDVAGEVHVTADEVAVRRKGPLSLRLDVAIEPERTTVGLDLSVAASKLVRVGGALNVGGDGLLTRVGKDKELPLLQRLGDPGIDLTVTVEPGPIARLSPLAPGLGTLPGQLSGSIAVKGPLAAPTAGGGIVYDQFVTLDGSPGRAAVELSAGAEQLEAKVALGAPAGGTAPVEIRARLPREALGAYLGSKRCYGTPAAERTAACTPSTLPLTVATRASRVDVQRLFPQFALAGRGLSIAGLLTWNMDGDIRLTPGEEGVTQRTASLLGGLTLADGVVGIPGTDRRYHDVAVALTSRADALVIDHVRLRESDAQRKGRSFDLSGELRWKDFEPQGVKARLAADRFLVFGSDKVGPADAPRGELSLDASVTGDLSQPIKKLDVVIEAMELLIPDRFTRAHQAEQTHLGDVIYLDEHPRAAGKLPAMELPAPSFATADPFAPGYREELGPPKGLDVRVHIENPVHAVDYPMNIYLAGDVRYEKRGDAKRISGRLEVVDGDLALGGLRHKVHTGSIVFNEKFPAGGIDLRFGRTAHPVTLRDVSKASAGDEVRIDLSGPISNRTTKLHGAASPGTLFDLLSVHNAGRPRYLSQPDMPASQTVEYPQHDNLLILSYLQVNVPHLLFLDRIAAWSDAYDEPRGYGRMRHVEAERYASDRSWRVRGVMRRARAGESDAEMQYDWLWVSQPRVQVGAGLRVGNRGGGGPGLFLEYSSDD